MLIINADDWGRSVAETDSALECHRQGRITSVSAMVFMRDSERAAKLALENGIDAGLHLNLSQNYNGREPENGALSAHRRIVRFLSASKYSVLFYRPDLRRAFREVYRSQEAEFVRIYGHPPTHVDGHQHKHLCLNVLFHDVIPPGQKVRRSFSFRPGEKGMANRLYRAVVDRRLAARYFLTDAFFALSQHLAPERLLRVIETSSNHSVELMTHPANEAESAWLLGSACANVFRKTKLATFASR